MGIEENVDIKEKLDEHDTRIQKLEQDNIYVKDKLNSISAQTKNAIDEVGDLKSVVTRLETTVLNTNNTILTALTQVVTNTSNNNTQIITTRANNRKDIIIRGLWITGVIILGLFAAKGINISLPMF